MNLMNCRGGRRRRLDLDYAKSFASSKMPTCILRRVRRKSPRIRRVSGFDPHRPYQPSHSLHRTCDFREAAKGSNKSDGRRLVADETLRYGWQADELILAPALHVPTGSQKVAANPCADTF